MIYNRDFPSKHMKSLKTMKIFEYFTAISANLSTTSFEYPVGRNFWKISDNEGCGLSDVELTLTVCNETQYTCDDGFCVHLERR